jgi:hypothetical protein
MEQDMNIFHRLTTPLYGRMLAFDCADLLANTHNEVFMNTVWQHSHRPDLAHVWPKAVSKGADRLLSKGWWNEFIRMTSWVADRSALMAGINSRHIHETCAQMPEHGAGPAFTHLCQNIAGRSDLMDSITPGQVSRAARDLIDNMWGGYKTYLLQPLQAAVSGYPSLSGAIARLPEAERMVVFSGTQTADRWPLVAIANPITDQIDFFVHHDGKQSIRQLFDRCSMWPDNCCGELVIFQALDALAAKPAAATAAKRALNELSDWGANSHSRWVLGSNADKVSTILRRHTQAVTAVS